MMRRALLLILTAGFIGPALAQAPASMGDSAKALIGTWEFSNADRDKICSATFKSDSTKVGFKVEFDKSCAGLFPVVSDVAGWSFPDNDLLRFLELAGGIDRLRVCSHQPLNLRLSRLRSGNSVGSRQA